MFEKSQLLRCSTHAGHGEVVEGLVLKHLAEPGGNLSLRGMPHAKAGHAPGSLAAYYEERWRRTYEGWLPDGYVERTSSEESTSSMISHRYQILSTHRNSKKLNLQGCEQWCGLPLTEKCFFGITNSPT